MLDFMDNCKYTMLAGRVLLAIIYFLGGFSLFGDMSGVVGYAASKGVPELLVTAAFALKLLGGLAIIIGFQTRLAALGLVIFTLCTAFIFHPLPRHGFHEGIIHGRWAADTSCRRARRTERRQF